MALLVKFSRVLPIVGLFLLLISSNIAFAGGGYFSIGYGHVAKQTSGAVTAVAEDAYAGASNPGKLTAAGNQFEIGAEFFNPHRRIERKGATGDASIYNFSDNSRNSFFIIPDLAYAYQLNSDITIGITAYANGGLNSEYPGTTGIPDTNGNPSQCGSKAGNFYTGCDKVGFDLAQLIIAPTIAWKVAPGHSIGIAPLFAIQSFEAFGFQGLMPFSKYPSKMTNNGHDTAFGVGVRVGWYAEPTPWLSLGAAYSSKVYMQEFDEYKGLFAEGSFDIPANYSIGAALRPSDKWLLAVDIQRIAFKDIRSLGNSVQSSLGEGAPLLGSSSGTAFGWDRDQTNYRFGLTYFASKALTLRAGYAYGKRANDNDVQATTLSILTPNPEEQFSFGLSWKTEQGNQLHVGYERFVKETYSGPSALFPGATESVKPYVNALHVAYTWAL